MIRAAPPRTADRRNRAQRWLLVVMGGLLVLFLAVPVVGLFTSLSWQDFVAGLEHPLVWTALKLSLLTTASSLVVVVSFGTPLAWLLARASGRWFSAVEMIVQLPLVLPPAVAGVAMLLVFGRKGLLAAWLYPEGWSVAFTTAAVVIAQVFVSAPFFVQAAASAFRRVDGKLLIVARTFGASPFRILFGIALPLAAPGLVAGASMSFARALGEFGATLMFAGNLEGKTQTLPLAIYTTLESDWNATQALSIVLVILAFCLLVCVHLAQRLGGARHEVVV